MLSPLSQSLMPLWTPPKVASSPDIISGLVLDLETNDGTGSTAADSSGLGNNASLSGSPAWVPGPFGGAIQLNSASQYGRISRTTALEPASLTIAAWVMPLAQTGSVQCWILKTVNDDGTSPFASYAITFDRSGTAQPEFFLGSGTFFVEGTFADSIPLNEWCHVAGTFDGTTGVYQNYLNGVADGSAGSFAHALTYGSTSAYDLWIGVDGAAHALSSRVAIAKIRIYSRALSSDQIAALYAAR